jgi:hypothetical protein
VPPADIEGQPGLVDTAATAIAADALRLLTAVDSQRATVHQAAADRLSAALARTHLTGTAARCPPGTPPGALTHSCYQTGPRGRQQVECVWGEYHLLRALAGTDDAPRPSDPRCADEQTCEKGEMVDASSWSRCSSIGGKRVE